MGPTAFPSTPDASTDTRLRDRDRRGPDAAFLAATAGASAFDHLLSDRLAVREERPADDGGHGGRQRYEAPSEGREATPRGESRGAGNVSDRTREATPRSDRLDDRTGGRNATDSDHGARAAKGGPDGGAADAAREATGPDDADAPDTAEMLAKMQPAGDTDAAPAAATATAATGAAGGSGNGSATTPAVGALRLVGGWRPVTAPPPAPETPPDPDSARIRGQVMSAMQRHAGLKTGDGTLKLHLQPAHLGRVDVMLQRNGGQLEIVLRVESAAAEQALREGADELVQSILARGGNWSEVVVRVENDGADDADEGTDEGTEEEGAEERAGEDREDGRNGEEGSDDRGDDHLTDREAVNGEDPR